LIDSLSALVLWICIGYDNKKERDRIKKKERKALNKYCWQTRGGLNSTKMESYFLCRF
jgi:hypothetical protein